MYLFIYLFIYLSIIIITSVLLFKGMFRNCLSQPNRLRFFAQFRSWQANRQADWGVARIILTEGMSEEKTGKQNTPIIKENKKQQRIFQNMLENNTTN